MHKEIGSEFWDIPVKGKITTETLPYYEHHAYLLSGRTALDFIIQDIKATKQCRTVYMPSYCCHTMIQPFVCNGILIKFYDVAFKNGHFIYELDFDIKCDVVLIMQYFGYVNEAVERGIETFKAKGKIVIEDATHSWFSDNPFSKHSDYVFASFRKWMGLACGAIAIKNDNDFILKRPPSTNMNYITLRRQAADLKKRYIEQGIGEKEKYLKLFNQAEELLEFDYRNYGIPDKYENIIQGVDGEYIRFQRQTNARYLIQGLKGCTNINSITVTDSDAPLFVPIIVSNGNRDKLRQFLINNDIFCPIHWPLSSNHKISNASLYANELSLICDQRYTLAEMERMVMLIRKFFGG